MKNQYETYQLQRYYIRKRLQRRNTKVISLDTNMNIANKRSLLQRTTGVPTFLLKVLNANEAIIAPDFPDAAEIPCAKALNRVGKTSAGYRKVVEFAPKLKKNWKWGDEQGVRSEIWRSKKKVQRAKSCTCIKAKHTMNAVELSCVNLAARIATAWR